MEELLLLVWSRILPMKISGAIITQETYHYSVETNFHITLIAFL